MRNGTSQSGFPDFSGFLERIHTTDATEQALSVKTCVCYNYQGINTQLLMV